MALQLGEISFCDKIGYNVRSDELKKKVLQELESEYGFKVIQRHFDKFNPDVHVPLFQRSPHLVATRSNGNPYLLYLTRINFVNQCIFIDKKIQQGYFYPRMIVAKLWFDDVLFNNTLMDGEMIKDGQGRWTFLIGDLIADAGRSLRGEHVVKRLNRLHQLLDTQYVADSTNVCDVRAKRYFQCNELARMLEEFLPRLPYTCRGLYFKPPYLRYKDVLHNFDDTLVVKVQRTKYKGLGAFLTQDNVVGSSTAPPNPQASNAQQAQVNAAMHATMNAHVNVHVNAHVNAQVNAQSSQPAAAAAVDAAATRELLVMKTGQSDIYDVLDEGGVKLSVACVNRVSVSKQLRTLFAGTTPMTRIRMECRWVEAFQKWEPLRMVCVL